MKWSMGVAAGVLAIGVSACGGGEQTYSCDFRNSTTDAEDRCQQRSIDPLVGATSAVQFQQLCDSVSLAGEYRDGACPLDNAIATCDLDPGGGLETVRDVYYAPDTVEQAEIDCGDDVFTAL